jgi:hypothetical protein
MGLVFINVDIFVDNCPWSHETNAFVGWSLCYVVVILLLFFFLQTHFLDFSLILIVKLKVANIVVLYYFDNGYN